MDIQRQIFESHFKTTETYKREAQIRQKDILEFSSNFGYFNIIANDAWEMWQTAKARAVPETLKADCMIGQTWFVKGSPVSVLIKYAEGVYIAEAVAQNSKIKFGTDDNEHWFAHDVPFYGTVQIDRIEEHGLVEWDIYFNDCWQGPFNSKSECIKHLEDCILEQRAEAQEPSHD